MFIQTTGIGLCLLQHGKLQLKTKLAIIVQNHRHTAGDLCVGEIKDKNEHGLGHDYSP